MRFKNEAANGSRDGPVWCGGETSSTVMIHEYGNLALAVLLPARASRAAETQGFCKRFEVWPAGYFIECRIHLSKA